MLRRPSIREPDDQARTDDDDPQARRRQVLPPLRLQLSQTPWPILARGGLVCPGDAIRVVGGEKAGQLNPSELTYRIGRSGGTLSNAEHLIQVPSPGGACRITATGIWQGTSGDRIECLAVDKAVFTTMDVSKVYVLTFTGSDDTDNSQVLGSGVATLEKGRELVLGCDTEFDTGTSTLIQPITFSFTKISQNVKTGKHIVIRARSAGRSSLLHR